MKITNWRKIIKDNGLTHASSRKLPLITNSCIFFGFTNILKKKLGYSYEVIGNIGKKDESYFLINEEKVGKSFYKVAKNKNLNLLINDLQGFLNENKQKITKVKKEKDYFKVLKIILDVYPELLFHIGFYNSIMRYVKDNQDRAKKLGKSVFLAAKDKDILANLIYTEIEPLLKNCVIKIGKNKGFEGDLLRYTILKELKRYIKEKKISKNEIVELSKRRKNYLYLVCNNREYITSDKEIIDSVYKEFIDIKRDTNILKGTIAYPGKVIGKVYKAFHGVKISKPGYVLVTNATKPEDTPLLRKFAAIITNEGGILSHIAIVAREFKIPSIMSTKIATKVLKDGDLVEVDAEKGVVKVLKKAK